MYQYLLSRYLYKFYLLCSYSMLKSRFLLKALCCNQKTTFNATENQNVVKDSVQAVKTLKLEINSFSALMNQ